MKNRIEWLDIAKGIGIILVVIGHIQNESVTNLNGVNNVIYQFHMPMFFILSGLLYRESNTINYKAFIYRKLQTLYLPYIIANLLVFSLIIVKNCILGIKLELSQVGFTVAKILLGLEAQKIFGATWFLATLFYVSIIFVLINKLCNSYKTKPIAVIFLAITCTLIGLNIKLPYKLDTALVSVGFYAIGWHLSKILIYGEKILEIDKCWLCIGGVITTIVVIIIAKYNVTSLANNEYTNKIMFIIASISGTTAIVCICLLLGQTLTNSAFTRGIMFLGKQSIWIVIGHLLAYKLVILLQILIYGENLYKLSSYPCFLIGGYWWILYTIIGLYVPVYSYVLIEKVFTTSKTKVAHYLQNEINM